MGDYLVGKEQLGSVMDSKGTTRLLDDRLAWEEKGGRSETGLLLELLRGEACFTMWYLRRWSNESYGALLQMRRHDVATRLTSE
jgi:hypothetical protein